MKNDFDNSETIQFVCLKTNGVPFTAIADACVPGDVIIKSCGGWIVD